MPDSADIRRMIFSSEDNITIQTYGKYVREYRIQHSLSLLIQPNKYSVVGGLVPQV